MKGTHARLVGHFLNTFKFHSFKLCLINRLDVLWFDWKIQSLRIAHVILWNFHGHRKFKSIYLKKCDGMKLVNVTASPSWLYRYYITGLLKPIFLSQIHELYLCKNSETLSWPYQVTLPVGKGVCISYWLRIPMSLVPCVWLTHKQHNNCT